uniref:1,4-dihydroxy-2-naphthoate polyprenyltransferase n=1 Tax=Euglena longa TaxID=3037 RepID=A0A6B9RG15_EUGLO|nr:1,4-dihydroxy-2-naphthoate polyprenyltransferase [Euglena longa]
MRRPCADAENQPSSMQRTSTLSVSAFVVAFLTTLLLVRIVSAPTANPGSLSARTLMPALRPAIAVVPTAAGRPISLSTQHLLHSGTMSVGPRPLPDARSHISVRAAITCTGGAAVVFVVLIVTRVAGSGVLHQPPCTGCSMTSAWLLHLHSAAASEDVGAARGLAEQQQHLWRAAIKLPMYSVAVMPAIVAGGWLLAFQAEAFRPLQLMLFLVAAVTLLAWENLANDAYDAETGIDVHKPHSVVTLTGRRDRVLLLANVALLAGLALMSFVAYRSSFDVLVLVLGCCALGYLYQGPPFRLGYQGLGEPLCFLAFGPLAFKAALRALGGDVTWWTAWQVGAGPALATTLVLFCSHFHQVEEDQTFGKRSPVVRLGTERAAALIPILVAATLALEVAPVLMGVWPVTCLLALLGLPAGVNLSCLLGQHHARPEAIQGSKFIALQFLQLSSLGLAAGFALSYLL